MSNIAAKLAKVIDRTRIATDSSTLEDLSWDALSEVRMHPNHHPELRTPLCAVKPQSTDEVRRIVQFANAEKIALVPFGKRMIDRPELGRPAASNRVPVTSVTLSVTVMTISGGASRGPISKGRSVMSCPFAMMDFTTHRGV